MIGRNFTSMLMIFPGRGSPSPWSLRRCLFSVIGDIACQNSLYPNIYRHNKGVSTAAISTVAGDMCKPLQYQSVLFSSVGISELARHERARFSLKSPSSHPSARRHLSTVDAATSSRAPVVIVGAGPTGLTTALLLSRLGIDSMVLERRPSLSIHPRAHFINHRTMEIFRSLSDLSNEIVDRMPPLDEWRSFVYCSSMIGDRRSLLGVVDHFDRDQRTSRNDALSPEPVAHLSQHTLVPLLARRTAETSNDAANGVGSIDLRFGCAVARATERADGVTVEVEKIRNRCRESRPVVNLLDDCGEAMQEKNSSSTNLEGETIDAKFVVAADGAHSGLRRQLNIKFEGPGPMQHLVNIHFRSQELGNMLLSSKERRGMLYFVFNPSVIAVVVAHSLQDGEFVAQIPYFPPLQEPSAFASLSMARQIVRRAAGVPTLAVEILEVRPWTLSAYVAERYSSAGGRILLAGDAAHVVPPSGALGMNTGVQDAHNLAWKIAMAVREDPGTSLHRCTGLMGLLHSYEVERKPVAEANMRLSVANFDEALRVAQCMGLDYRTANSFNDILNSRQASWIPSFLRRSVLDASLSVGRIAGSAIGAIRHEALNALFEGGETLRLQYPKEDLGFVYSGTGAAIAYDTMQETGCGDGDNAVLTDRQAMLKYTAAKPRDAPYVATTLPGARFPHFWMRTIRSGILGESFSPGAMLSSIDVMPAIGLNLCLFVKEGPGLQQWLEAARSARTTRARLDGMWQCEGVFERRCSSPPLEISIFPIVVLDAESEDLPLQVFDHDIPVFQDVGRVWSQLQSFDPALHGADVVLVRPDGHVAWRSHSSGSIEEKGILLRDAMERVLFATEPSQ